VGAAVTLLGGCASAPPPVLPTLTDEEPKVPVVLVPGITGTVLRDRETGDARWGTGARLVFPRDAAYELALPVTGAGSAVPRLEPAEVIERITLAGLFRRDVYGPIVETLEANGYRRGDLADPRPGDTLFLFGYDWRRDNVLAAGVLRERLEKLRRARGEDRLEVDLLCQSNGAHICRYLAKHGGAPLEQAESGDAAPPADLEIRKLVLIGSSNGGGLRILREVDRGRSYLPVIGREMSPEALFTLPALYQDLPVYRTGFFLDEDGRELDVDLFDAASWRRYGWSVFGEKVRRRLDRSGRPDLFGTEEDRLAFLQATLDRARRIHHLLHRDVPGFGVGSYYLVQNVYTPTPERAVLLRGDDGTWQTLFTGDEELRRRPYLQALASAPGDGHATFRSQRWLSRQELALIAREPLHVEGPHFELLWDPATLRGLVEFLADR